MRLCVVEGQRHLRRTYICMFRINQFVEYPAFGLPILIQNALLPVFSILAHVHTRRMHQPEGLQGAEVASLRQPRLEDPSFPSTGPIRGQGFTTNFHVWENDAAEFCMWFFQDPHDSCCCWGIG